MRSRLPPAALILGLLLPLPLLSRPLGADEALSVWFARPPLGSLLFYLCDPRPPGYYLLLKGWLALGETEPWLRLPSLLASALAVALTAHAGRRIIGPRAGGLAALLLATFPLQSWYAAEVRMSALAQALGVALLLPGWRLLSPPAAGGRGAGRGRERAMIGFWLLAVAALVVDVSALLPYVALQLWWLARGRPGAGGWLRLQAAVFVSVAPWWLLRRVGADSYLALSLAVQARRLGLMLDPQTAGALLWGAAIAAGVLAAGVAWRLAAGQSRLRRIAGGPVGTALLLAIWLLLLAASAAPRLFPAKQLLVAALPYLALGLAHGLAQTRPRAVWGIAVLGLAVTLWLLASFQQERWDRAVASVTEANATGSSVAWVDDLAVPAFDYYIRRSPQGATAITWAPLPGAALPALPGATPPPGGDLWLVLAENPYRDLHASLPAGFYREYQPLSEQHTPGIGIYRYRRLAELLPPPPATPAPPPEATWGLRLPSPLAVCR